MILEYGALFFLVVIGIVACTHTFVVSDERHIKGFLLTLTIASVILCLVGILLTIFLLFTIHDGLLSFNIPALSALAWIDLITVYTAIALERKLN